MTDHLLPTEDLDAFDASDMELYGDVWDNFPSAKDDEFIDVGLYVHRVAQTIESAVSGKCIRENGQHVFVAQCGECCCLWCGLKVG